MFRQVLVLVAVLCSVNVEVSGNAQYDLSQLISNLGPELPEYIEDLVSQLPDQLDNIKSGGDDDTEDLPAKPAVEVNVDPNVLQKYLNQIISSALTNPLQHIFDGKSLFLDSFGRRIKRADLNANSIADTALFFVRDYIEKKNLNQIPIPNIEQEFRENIAGINTKGYIKTWNGYLKGLSTIRRTGDFKMKGDIRKENITITGSLGFEELVAYSKYEAKWAKMGPRGHVDVIIGNSAIDFTLAGKLEDLSKLHIHKCEMKIRTLDDVKVKATGLGPINWIVSKIATSQVNKMKESQVIDEKVKDAIKGKLDEMGWTISLDF